jgi:serine/threonine protein kinase
MAATATHPEEYELVPVAMGEPADERIEEHLHDCQLCQDWVKRLRAELSALRADPGDRADPTLPETPVVVGKYLVVERLDWGAQAAVYRVIHPKLGRHLVLKWSHQPVGNDERASIVEEGRRLAELEPHANIVKIHDLDFYNDRPFLVMEYVHGGNLETYARDNPATPRRAARLVARVAGALAMVHRKDIVHRDIKPRNILIDEVGEPRLIDFGLARLQNACSDPVATTWGGTLPYMAPEQARREHDRIGPRSDIFGLGAVLFFLLTGRPPFGGETQAEIWDRARRCDFDPAALRNARVPRRLERICLKALAVDPADRYATAEEMGKDLNRFVHALPTRLVSIVTVCLMAIAILVATTLRPGLRRGEARDPQPSPPPLTGTIDLRIWEPGNPIRQRVSLRDPGAVPLKAGDLVRVEVQVSRPAYLYIVWINTEGVPEPVYPWKPGTWGEIAEAQRPVAQLKLPETDGALWPIKQSPSGTEMLLLLARDEPLPPGVDLKSDLEGLPLPASKDELPTPVWFDDWRLVRREEKPGDERGPEFIEELAADTLLRAEGLLKKRLAPLFSMMRAVGFANRGQP